MEKILEKLKKMKVKIKEEIEEIRKENQKFKREMGGKKKLPEWKSSMAGKENRIWRKGKKKK
jgi:hypothetical protein